ncbi:MAG: class IV adenylate cyclase [Candidatus Pacearchaeota archaeon]|jgi:predicted adenylyl cyclase CyaB
MKRLNIELKAICKNPEEIRKILLENNAEYIGKDNQRDTYFNVKNGRLKIRRGNIEKCLVFYDRIENPNQKESRILMHQNPSTEIDEILEKSLGIFQIVDKQREIYFIANVKFHIDEVKNLGNFIEIEVIQDKEQTKEELIKQFNYYKKLLKIKEKDLINKSYSDMVI